MSKFETSALAAAGYSGFIPNIKYEIGKSYGNATGEILERDKVFQARRQRMAQEIASKQHQYDNEDSRLLHSGCANGDERFSHALVSGYTGFVPRLQEHFGKGYVKTTQEALHDFAEMLDKREQLPPKLAALYERAKQMQLQGGNNGSSASVNSIANAANGNRLPPIEQDEHQFSRSFMSGYTGYIPQLKNHFGKSVRRTIADGDIHYHITSKLHRTNGHSDLSSISRAIPIPGFTGNSSTKCTKTLLNRSYSW